MTVDPDGPQPPYMQVADALRDEITHARIKPGSKLPSIRELSNRFSVSGMTAQNAIKLLRDEHWIYTTRRGSFVIEMSPELAAEVKAVEKVGFLPIIKHLEGLDEAVFALRDQVKALQDEVRALSARNYKSES